MKDTPYPTLLLTSIYFDINTKVDINFYFRFFFFAENLIGSLQIDYFVNRHGPPCGRIENTKGAEINRYLPLS